MIRHVEVAGILGLIYLGVGLVTYATTAAVYQAIGWPIRDSLLGGALATFLALQRLSKVIG